ncbi:MAG: ABC transporter ATP-binding protein [Candidatus Riflebacteria bacterium]|nr:ABC transporter ATP-binding protein [Candidatus Riflebacteria bacterium]
MKADETEIDSSVCLHCGMKISASALLCSSCGCTNINARAFFFQIDTTKLTFHESLKILKRLFFLNIPYWRFQALVIILTAAIFVLHLPGPYLNKVLIDQIVITGSKTHVHLILLANLLICILIFAFSTIQSYISFFVGSNIERDLQRDIFSRFQKLSISFYETMPIGEVIYTATGSLESLKHFLLYEFNIILSNLFFVFMGAAILFSINVKLAFIAVVSLPLWAFLAQYFNGLQIPIEQKVQAQTSKIYSAYSNNITHIGLIRSYSMENHERKKFFEIIAELLQISIERILLFNLSNNLLVKLTMVSSAILMWVGGLAIINREISVGEMFAFTSFLAYLWTPTDALLMSFSSLPSYLIAALRVFFVLDSEKTNQIKDGDMELPEIEGGIEFHNISFGYTPGKPMLRDINLVIHPGEKIAVVGSSGSGKTTLIKVLLRYYDPSAGSIFIDGFDIRNIRATSLRQRIGVVMQNQFVFPGSFAENIRYGKPDASMDEVIEAAKNANAHEFICSNAEGYETKIGGEGGVSLSGGEAQRIAIARVILKKAPIVVLDEATSALDNQTEVLIQGAMDYLMRDRTCIIIAHRLSTILDADRICVFDHGSLIQTGTHEHLLEVGGPYSDLYHRRVKTHD